MIRVHVLVHVLALVCACERDHHADAVPRIACKADRDCPVLPAGSRCAYACGPDLCQLVGVLDRVGAGPCFGTRRAGATAMEVQDQLRVFGVCDVNAGLYCDRSNRRCATVKARGATCRTDEECGREDRCDDTTLRCVTAGTAGEACQTTRCGDALYCDEHARCAPRRPIGATCELADDCGSFACERAHCVAAPAPVACPVAI